MKLRAFTWIALAFGLTGCTSITPASFLQSTYADTKGTTPRKFSSSTSIDKAAKCVMLNIENRIASFHAFPSEEPSTPGTKEIRARSEVGMAAVVELQPIPSGTEISIWISNHYPLKGTLAERISNGC